MFKKYRVYCDTEATHVHTAYMAVEPTSCPNDGGHSIDTAKTTEVLEPRSTPVRDIILAQSSKPYFDTNSSSYKALAQFHYRGADEEGIFASVKVVVSTPNVSATANIRLVDEATGAVIAEQTAITFAQSTSLYVVNMTLYPENIPAASAVFEVQAANPTNNQKIRVHSLVLEK